MTVDLPDDCRDDGVDVEIGACLDATPRQSFFLFAGAGSGKTESLRRALEYALRAHGSTLQLRGQQIAVITYTNAACDEITGRLHFSPLVKVSTIHSFAWGLIKGFNGDIKRWLEAHLQEENAKLNEQQRKGRATSQAARDRASSLSANLVRLEKLALIRAFTYSPTGDNRSRDSLSHSEVLQLAAYFIATKPLMQDLVASRFPILFVDESQDTNARLMDAFFALQKARPDRFCLGLFGDMMQQIYTDGKPQMGDDLPADWKKPVKKLNHRCPQRVVALINSIRAAVDSHYQEARSDAKEGTVRLFMASADSDRAGAEALVRTRMTAMAADEKWASPAEVTTLILEHHMAAARLGFAAMFTPLDKARLSKTGIRSGELSLLRLFSKQVLPIFEAKDRGDEFAVAAIVRAGSPYLSKENLVRPGIDQVAQIDKARAGVDQLMALRAAQPNLRFLDVLRSVAASGLFEIPRTLLPFVDVATDLPIEPVEAVEQPPFAGEESPLDEAGTESEQSELLAAARTFLETEFAQISAYRTYISGQAGFATHHGVKGLQFPRVLVIADDTGAAGFTYNFEKLLTSGAGDSGVDRTRRLFYVTASRTQESLAVLIYTKDAESVNREVVDKGWFDPAEVETLPV